MQFNIQFMNTNIVCFFIIKRKILRWCNKIHTDLFDFPSVSSNMLVGILTYNIPYPWTHISSLSLSWQERAQFIKTNTLRPTVVTDLHKHLTHLLIHFYSVCSAAMTAYHRWQGLIKVWLGVSLSFLHSLLIYRKLHFGRY